MYLTIYISFVSSKCREDQQSLLLQFKNNLTFDPESSDNLKSWNQSIGCCDWEGVTCDEDGQVIGLELIYESISGGLDNSSTLFSLQHLSYISLDGNNFSSAVPEAFANLKNLTALRLSHCELIGMFPRKIFQMPTLSFIDISYNPNLRGFFPEFPINGSLQKLSVSSTNFSGQLPNSIGNLKNLSYLDLSSSNFSGSILSLGMCKNLVDIDLGNNSFSGMIPSSIFMLPSLEIIRLSNNKFYGQLSDFINASSTIELIDLSGNHLEGPIPISLLQLTNLTDLILSFNMFNGTIEPNMFSKLGNITKLDISHNNLTIIDTSISLTPFPLLPSLISVGFASCKLTTFPQFLKNHSQLEDIDLSDNHISGTIPKWIFCHDFLGKINLSHNYLDNWTEPILNNKSSYLSILDLNSNFLQGPLPALPQSISYIDFSNNNFSSIIPSKLGEHLHHTLFLSFASNNLQGYIPGSICNAPYLQVLDLSNNSLTGTIPKCLIAMNGTLSILDLGWNKLNGKIHTFPGLCSLTSLYLNGNSLRGKLPKYLTNCGMLEILDIRDNQIYDQFPCWLKNISTLRILVLGSNKFHGSLKCSGTKVAWPQLQIFDLASNNFDGRIPMSFFETWKATMAHENDGINKSRLGPLIFQIQKFGDLYNRAAVLKPSEPSGLYYQGKVTITSKEKQIELVKILPIYTAVDLSCNKFEGVIPQEFGLLNALYILNLSHNAFLGPIPSSLGNMKELESLDLSHNCLTGNIPTQITKLTFLSVINLSFNHLVGRIPIGTQIQSFPASSFKGNDGLCGLPLSQNCSGDRVPPTSISNADTKNSIDWNFISVELGFAFGIGIVVLSLVFYKSWRIRYWKCVDDILYHIFPHLDFVYERCGEQSYRTLRWKPY
ncbi:hypothetical protein VNO77_07539 [Canavalia gladiata]|uniref:Leucine-rich repeat-containing N-terminal plant-type domain-containing protein n=1 Tax=Canavalia gladiata TaxID=3824 RepID=A0AAN9QTF7_CANGL